MREKGLEISPGCDRNTADTKKTNTGFINGCVLPLFELMAHLFENADICIKNATNNAKLWKESNTDIELTQNEA